MSPDGGARRRQPETEAATHAAAGAAMPRGMTDPAASRSRSV
jgi:hypothetical protein